MLENLGGFFWLDHTVVVTYLAEVCKVVGSNPIVGRCMFIVKSTAIYTSACTTCYATALVKTDRKRNQLFATTTRSNAVHGGLNRLPVAAVIHGTTDSSFVANRPPRKDSMGNKIKYLAKRSWRTTTIHSRQRSTATTAALRWCMGPSMQGNAPIPATIWSPLTGARVGRQLIGDGRRPPTTSYLAMRPASSAVDRTSVAVVAERTFHQRRQTSNLPTRRRKNETTTSPTRYNIMLRSQSVPQSTTQTKPKRKGQYFHIVI